jgi:quinol monooxygenase YgiN
VLFEFRMVQLLVRLIVPKDGVHEQVHALRTVLWGAQQARGCRFAQISLPVDDGGQLEYVEEWDDEGELREQFGSERFVHLLGLLELATQPPLIEFRVFSATYGLEYVSAGRAALALKVQ